MIWKGRRRSDNVEDRRRVPAKGVAAGGIGTLVLVLAIYLLGGDPTVVLDSVQQTTSGEPSSRQETAKEKELAEFVSVVLADTEDVWTDIFKREGKHYRMPKLVIFSGTVDSACGRAGKSTGPFYCPADGSVYIDLSFYDDLQHRFGASGDFAMAYVIAHEVGHHVQNLTGTMDRVMRLRSRMGEGEFNPYLVRLELQADYYAGVWAHHAERMKLLEEGDLEEALNAASAVGDDRIQQRARGYVVPDSFTHGTSDQRMRWFHRGFRSGTMEDGDTFGTGEL